jgi:tetratricopeptide (TPR) repeat protein
MRKAGLLIIILFCFWSAFSQNAKTFFNEGKELIKKQKFREASESLTKSIELNPKNIKAYELRAKCFEEIRNYEKALSDYRECISLNNNNSEYYIKAGDCLVELERYAEAFEFYTKVGSVFNETNDYVLEQLALCRIKNNDFEGALKECSEGITFFKDNHMFHLYKGVAYDSLKNYQAAALSYTSALNIAKQKLSKNAQPPLIFKTIYYNLALAQFRLFLYDEAHINVRNAIEIDKGDYRLHQLKSRIAFYSGDYSQSMEAINRALELKPGHLSFFWDRAMIQRKLGQFLKSITDLSSIIEKSDTAFHSLKYRALCYEDIARYEEALADLNKALKIASKKQLAEVESAKKRISAKSYEKNRESEAPEIVIAFPKQGINNDLMISTSSSYVEVRGRLMDRSLIRSITINGIEAEFSRDSINPGFKATINIGDKSEIELVANDIYLNTTRKTFVINRSESNPPAIRLFVPYSETRGEIFLDNKSNAELTIEGKIEDESHIKRVDINGINAMFSSNELNPGFSCTVNIGKKDSVIVSAEDKYGNITRLRLKINAKEAIQRANDPMGRTWLIFIENSNYIHYSSLDGPSKDVLTIKDALGAYRFENRITKKNLTLAEMDKFFRIELRDMVRQQQVNSIMIWFAGHGKYINESGYWVPADAKRDDEAGFFPISNLKGYIGNYGNSLIHTLVISDACESGSSFYIQDNDLQKTPTCKDLNKVKQKSAEVFSSTSNEKASDNSIFTQSFANALLGNPDRCISIADIVKLVAPAVEKNQRQRTRFGKIQGLSNEGGSFVFMKNYND